MVLQAPQLIQIYVGLRLNFLSLSTFHRLPTRLTYMRLTFQPLNTTARLWTLTVKIAFSKTTCSLVLCPTVQLTRNITPAAFGNGGCCTHVSEIFFSLGLHKRHSYISNQLLEKPKRSQTVWIIVYYFSSFFFFSPNLLPVANSPFLWIKAASYQH